MELFSEDKKSTETSTLTSDHHDSTFVRENDDWTKFSSTKSVENNEIMTDNEQKSRLTKQCENSAVEHSKDSRLIILDENQGQQHQKQYHYCRERSISEDGTSLEHPLANYEISDRLSEQSGQNSQDSVLVDLNPKLLRTKSISRKKVKESVNSNFVSLPDGLNRRPSTLNGHQSNQVANDRISIENSHKSQLDNRRHWPQHPQLPSRTPSQKNNNKNIQLPPLDPTNSSTKRPSSILKPTSKSLYGSGGHRRNCPKGIQLLQLQRQRNLSDNYEQRRNRQQQQQQNKMMTTARTDGMKVNEKTSMDVIINDDKQSDLLNNTAQNDRTNNVVNCSLLNKPRARRKNLFFTNLISNTNLDGQQFTSLSSLDDSKSINNDDPVKCTCHQQPFQMENNKSVQILTPTKSEQILFDPKLSAAESFIIPSLPTPPPPPLSSSPLQNGKIEKFINGDQNDNQLNGNQNNGQNNNNDEDNEKYLTMETTDQQNYHQRSRHRKNRGCRRQEQSPIPQQQSQQFCNCSPEQIKPFSYEICLNCRKPVVLIDTNVQENVDLIIENFSNQQPPPNLLPSTSAIHSNSASNSSHSNSSTAPLILPTKNPTSAATNYYSTLATPLVSPRRVSGDSSTSTFFYSPIEDGTDVDIEDSDIHSQSSEILDLDDNQSSVVGYFMDDNDLDSDNDDEDRPRFCRKCQIWFGSFDPSYPFTCNCLGPNGSKILKSQTMNTNDSGSVYSVHMQKDFRYYFQHPYARLFVAYFVIFCNFLIFAEDPLSHSLMECSIPVLGNVISLLFTKYPKEYEWRCIKAMLSASAIITGLLFGKYIVHHILLRRIFRLKMFRDESGTWMIMLITTFLSCFMASHVYNTMLLMFHRESHPLLITSKMGITYASFMKIAACGTWCGDFFTAWMITDMMLQDNLYPNWAIRLRRFWHEHANIRIVVFWTGSLVIAATVITIILNDVICWDCLTEGLFSTTEIHRAFLASSILVMDLLIVMQDWDFPHFVCDLNIKLPGLLQPSYTFNFFHKSVKFPAVEIKVTGKWFNYGIIVFVMMLDLNMWKNQVIYYPADYGQYMDLTTNRVCSITDGQSIDNELIWTYENRSRIINPITNRTYIQDDLMIFSRYVGYVWIYKATSLIPILAGFTFFFLLVYFYGRFPPKTDASMGGRLPKRRSPYQHQCSHNHSSHCRSSWRRERRDDKRKGHISWPGITIYDKDQKQDKHIHHNGNHHSIIKKFTSFKNNNKIGVTMDNNIPSIAFIPTGHHSEKSSNHMVDNEHPTITFIQQKSSSLPGNKSTSEQPQQTTHHINQFINIITTPISSTISEASGAIANSVWNVAPSIPSFICTFIPIVSCGSKADSSTKETTGQPNNKPNEDSAKQNEIFGTQSDVQSQFMVASAAAAAAAAVCATGAIHQQPQILVQNTTNCHSNS